MCVNLEMASIFALNRDEAKKNAVDWKIICARWGNEFPRNYFPMCRVKERKNDEKWSCLLALLFPLKLFRCYFTEILNRTAWKKNDRKKSFNLLIPRPTKRFWLIVFYWFTGGCRLCLVAVFIRISVWTTKLNSTKRWNASINIHPWIY